MAVLLPLIAKGPLALRGWSLLNVVLLVWGTFQKTLEADPINTPAMFFKNSKIRQLKKSFKF